MTMLEEAARVSDAVDGERNAEYGHPLQNFATIAALWSAAFGREFSREDVALAMILLKVARLSGPQQTHRDSWVDIAGYVNCVDAIHEANGAPKTMEELTRQYMREHQAKRQEQRSQPQRAPSPREQMDGLNAMSLDGASGVDRPPDRPLGSHCPDGGACKHKCGLEPCKKGCA